MATRAPAAHTYGYRVEPSAGIGLAVVVAYMLVFNGLQLVAGVDYADYFDTAGNTWRAVVIPLAAGAVLLVAFVVWSGWDLVWQDPARLPMGWTLRVAPLLFALGLALRFAGVDWAAVPSDLLLPIALSGVLVGFCEETLFRGIVLRCLRTTRRPEAMAVLWTSLVFGAFHVGNLLFGQSAAEVLLQVVMASTAGVILYLFRRWTGVLVAAMAAHGLWDASLFLIADHDTGNLAGSVATLLALVLVPLAGLVALVVILRRDQHLLVDPGGVHRAGA